MQPEDQKPKRSTKAKKSRPHLWKSGPDVIAHEQYQAWLVHKAQANFRGEPYELKYEDFRDLWQQDNRWASRGRDSDSTCMYRIQTDLPWTRENIIFEKRKDFLRKLTQTKVGSKYKKNKNEE